MRHRIAGRRLSRDSEHRLAMRRNLVSSLFEHGRVSTTIEKAKEVKSFAEKLITVAKKGDLASRRRVISLLGKRSIIEYEDGQAIKKGTVVNRLFSDIAPKYLDRKGGYTRIIKLAKRRLGDNGQVVLLQLVGETDKASSGGKKSAKNKRAKRAESFAQMSKGLSGEKAVEEEPVVEEQTEEAADAAVEEVQEEQTEQPQKVEGAEETETKEEDAPEVEDRDEETKK